MPTQLQLKLQSPQYAIPTNPKVPTSNTPSIAGKTTPIYTRTTTFHVHSALLTRTSKLLQNAAKPIDLSSTDADLFNVYSRWLYTESLPKSADFELLAYLYVLGEFLVHLVFQNCVLEAMMQEVKTSQPTIHVVRTIYDGTEKGSPARKLIVDMCARKMMPDARRIKRIEAEQDEELMVDLITALVKLRGKPEPDWSNPWVCMLEQYLFESVWEEGDEDVEMECEFKGRHVWRDEVEGMERRREGRRARRGPTGQMLFLGCGVTLDVHWIATVLYSYFYTSDCWSNSKNPP